MKNTSRLAFAFLFTALFSFAAHSQIRQTHLYIDDGTGHFTVLSAPAGGEALTFPSSGVLFSLSLSATQTLQPLQDIVPLTIEGAAGQSLDPSLPASLRVLPTGSICK